MEGLIALWDALPVLVQILLKIVLIMVPLMLMVAYYTYAERKVIGHMQVRMGPNRVGFFGFRTMGLGQPIADAVKLMFKEIVIPSGANKLLFLIAPMLSIAPALAAWAVFPFNAGMVLDLSPLQHVLVSAGRNIVGADQFQSYVAYQLTFGPGGPAD